MEPDKKDIKRVISAGVIIFRRTQEGPKFLLLYHGGGYWNFPKGKIESEERSKQAAVREVQEETGLRASDLRFLEKFKAYEKFVYRSGKEKIFKIVILFLAETNKKRINISWEHEGYGWFPFSYAKRLLSRYRENLKILENAYNFLRGQSQQNRRRT